MRKIWFVATVAILLLIFYKYCKPKYSLTTLEARNLPCKVKPYRDSLYVYIPYQFTIYNNRLTPLKLSSIFDGNTNGSSYGKYLLYNLDNLELNSYFSGSKKLIIKNNKRKYGDDNYWRIQYLFKYRKLIFPFYKRQFYYYKRFTLSNNNNIFKVNAVNRDSIKKQLYALNYNITTTLNKSVKDSLYALNNNKRVNVSFSSEPLVIKKIRARINNQTQELIYLNLNDSIKGRDMNKDENRKYILDFYRKQPEDMF